MNRIKDFNGLELAFYRNIIREQFYNFGYDDAKGWLSRNPPKRDNNESLKSYNKGWRKGLENRQRNFIS